MKKILVLIYISTFVVQCKKEKCELVDSEEQLANSVIGLCQLTAIGQENGEYSKHGEVYGTFTMNGTNVAGEYSLTDNGKLNTTVSYTNNLTTVNLEGESNSISNNLASQSTGTYAFNKNAKLLIVHDSIRKTTTSMSITKLSNKEMILRTPVIQHLSDSITLSSTLVISLNK